MDVESLLRAAWESLTADLAVQVVVTVLVAAAAFMLRPVRSFFSWLRRRVIEAWRAQSRIDAALAAVAGEGVFLAKPHPPAGYRTALRAGVPVLTIANLKGGVGKTTIAANLAAHFCLDLNERVLLIDLDFQGSLSSLVAGRHQPAGGVLSAAAQILDTPTDPRQFVQMAQSIAGVNGLFLLKSYYDVAAVENRQLVKWLLGAAGSDIRYRLATALSSEVIRANYDRVIIDAPPRLSVALINALCASTCVLIPTKLDKTSGEAVGTFVREIVALREADVCPELKQLLVVASMTNRNIGQKVEEGEEAEKHLLVAERQGKREIEAALSRAKQDLNINAEPAGILPLDTSIQQLAAIAEATGPYTNVESVRRMFQRLGKELLPYLRQP